MPCVHSREDNVLKKRKATKSGLLNLRGIKADSNAKCNKLKSDPGAEGGTRTPTGIRPLDPEPSASTSSATSAR